MIEYDEKAARATERSYLSPEIVRQRLRTLAVLALRAGEHVLNVGCGPGLLAHDMALQVGTSGRRSDHPKLSEWTNRISERASIAQTLPRLKQL